MKTKFLIGAFALPLFIASCNNEELDLVQSERPLETNEVVGNKLISQGMTISVSRYGEVESRLNAAGWETDDLVALGWYNGNTNISVEQLTYSDVKKTKLYPWWDVEGAATNAQNPLKQTDKNIYGNHKFVYDESGDFVTEANVYEGFHFAYYPYARMNKVGELTITPNGNAQTSEYEEDIYKNAFHISAQDIIKESDVAEDGSVVKNFDLKRLVNILNFKLTPSATWASNELLKNMKVTSVELSVGQNVFTPSYKVQPYYLPSAVYTDGELDKEATAAKMTWTNLTGKATTGSYKSKGALAVNGTTAKSIKTTVDLATATLDGEKSYRMFLFPTSAPATEFEGKNITLKVTIEGGGYFTISYSKTSDDNKKKLDILAAMLNGEYKANGKTYTLQEVMDGSVEGVHDGPVALPFVLNESEFTVSYNIPSRDAWNAAVNLATALAQPNKKNTFNVSGDVKFGETANDAVNLPTIPEGSSLEIKTGAKGQLSFLGKVKWPNDVENISWNVANKVVVGEGGALTVSANGALNANVTIEEGGKVIVSNKAYFNAGESVGTTLNDGRIEVVYGSHVSNINAESTGDVAFVVKSNTHAYEINALIENENASVTTLVVGKDINLNLNLSDVVNDPYGVTQKLEDLADINIELTGGSVTGDLATGKQNKVNKLKVVSGTTNKIVDVIPADIYVAKKAELTMATTEDQNLELSEVNVEVEGTLNVKAETHVNNIKNLGTINGEKTVHYLGTFDNANGTAKGVEPCDCGDAGKAADRETMQKAATDMNKKNGNGKVSNKSELVEALNHFISSEDILSTKPEWKATIFVNLLIKYGIEFEYTAITDAHVTQLEVLLGQAIDFGTAE